MPMVCTTCRHPWQDTPRYSNLINLFAAVDPMMSPHEISRSEPSARLPTAQSLAKSITFPHFFSHEKWKNHETNPPSWFPPNSMSQQGSTMVNSSPSSVVTDGELGCCAMPRSAPAPGRTSSVGRTCPTGKPWETAHRATPPPPRPRGAGHQGLNEGRRC